MLKALKTVTVLIGLFTVTAMAAENYVSLYPSPGSLYMSARVGSVDAASAAIINSGTEDATNVFVTHSCYGSFNVYDTCFSTIGKGMSCTINVSFMPYYPGYSTCSINVDAAGTVGATIFVSANATNY